MWIVYCHKHKESGKRYYGITSNLKKRWAGNGCCYISHDQAIGKAIKKYGWNAFSHIVLYDKLTYEEACEWEQRLVECWQTEQRDKGYNRCPGGEGGRGCGWNHDKATKRKISEGNKGKVHSEEQNKAHSEWMKKNFAGENNPKATAVRCITTGAVYATQSEAAKETGCPQSKISLCCNGKRTHTHGLKWEYVKE